MLVGKPALWIGNAVVLAGACLAIWVLLYSGMPQDSREWLDDVPWLLGSSLPYMLMYFGLRAFRAELRLWRVALVSALVLIGLAAFGFINGLVLHPSSMSAVLLVVIPFYQIVIFGSVLLVLLLAKWIMRRRFSGA